MTPAVKNEALVRLVVDRDVKLGAVDFRLEKMLACELRQVFRRGHPEQALGAVATLAKSGEQRPKIRLDQGPSLGLRLGLARFARLAADAVGNRQQIVHEVGVAHAQMAKLALTQAGEEGDDVEDQPVQRDARARAELVELGRPQDRLQPFVAHDRRLDLRGRIVIADVQRERGRVQRIGRSRVLVARVPEHLGDEPPDFATALGREEPRIAAGQLAPRVERVADRRKRFALDRAHVLVADDRQNVVDEIALVILDVCESCPARDPTLQHVVSDRHPLAEHRAHHAGRGCRGRELRRDLCRECAALGVSRFALDLCTRRTRRDLDLRTRRTLRDLSLGRRAREGVLRQELRHEAVIYDEAFSRHAGDEPLRRQRENVVRALGGRLDTRRGRS